MQKSLWAAVIFIFALCSVGVTEDRSPSKNRTIRTVPLNKITIPAKTNNNQTTVQGTVSITVVGADIRNTGYTVEIRNDSPTASGFLNVNTFKGTDGANPYSAPGGGVSVPSLGANASTQLTIDQPSGWNSGYTLFTVEVSETVNGKGVIVGKRSFSIPPL